MTNTLTGVEVNYDQNLVNQYTRSGSDPVMMGNNHEIAKFDDVTYKYFGDA